MEEHLKERLLQILSNPEEVVDPLVTTIAQESLEIVGERDLKQPFILDIAIYRYLMVKGTMIMKEYESAYKRALKELENTPLRQGEGTEQTQASFGIAVGHRSQAWT